MRDADASFFMQEDITSAPLGSADPIGKPLPQPSAAAAPSAGCSPGAARKNADLQAIAAGKEALRLDPQNPLHHLDLGKIYLAAGKKHLALHTFRKGLKYGCHRGLIKEIRRLGFRRPPTFPFLGRKPPSTDWLAVFSPGSVGGRLDGVVEGSLSASAGKQKARLLGRKRAGFLGGAQRQHGSGGRRVGRRIGKQKNLLHLFIAFIYSYAHQ